LYFVLYLNATFNLTQKICIKFIWSYDSCFHWVLDSYLASTCNSLSQSLKYSLLQEGVRWRNFFSDLFLLKIFPNILQNSNWLINHLHAIRINSKYKTMRLRLKKFLDPLKHFWIRPWFVIILYLLLVNIL